MHLTSQYNIISRSMSGRDHFFARLFNARLFKSNLLLCINIVLVAALAYKLSGLVFLFIDGVDGEMPQYTDTAGINDQFKAAEQKQVDTRFISTLNLFGAEKRKQKKVIEVRETTLKFTLRGVFAVEDPTKGIAIINAPGEFEKYFVAGQQVFGQATLKEIYRDRVVLFRKGRYETLRLPENALAFNTKKHKNKRLSRDEYAKRHVEYMRGQMKDIHKMTLNRMRNPWQYLYFEPALVDGKIKGLKLTAEEEKGFLKKHGIELGDIITSVNGRRLDGGAGVASALNEIGQADNLDFVIDRNGQPVSLHITNIQEHQQEQ